MIFTTYWFSIFALAFFPIYWSVQHPVLRQIVLLFACGVFHAHFAGPAGMAPILLVAFITYVAGIGRSPWQLRAGIVASIVTLLVYKYAHFIALDLVGAFSSEGGRWLNECATRWLPSAPPLAVSFFTFEFVHYLYDVLKGSPSIRSPAKFCAFIFFFPSLVAGPIKRYQPFLASLEQGFAAVSVDDIKTGLIRIATGLFKKVVLADNLTAAIQYWQPHYTELPLLARWAFLIALGLRILFDFSGYSDIAIGLASMAGISIPENFNYPYFATSVQDFWRRWHISLSSWIRDYVYIPLGGSRRGLPMKITNALIAFALCGLWHGPALNFVFWGVYHGAGLALSSNYRALLGPAGAPIESLLIRIPILSWLLTTLFVFIGWLFFFYPMGQATHMLKLLFVSNS